MYHVTKNNNTAKDLNFFLTSRSDILVKNSDNLSILPFGTQQDWEAWLKENHAESRGIWLKIAKKEARKYAIFKKETKHGNANTR